MSGGYSGMRVGGGQVLVEGWTARDLPCSQTPDAGRTWEELRANG